MQEKELKLIIQNYESYLKLINNLQNLISDSIQINHYFDTKDNLLAKKGIMLRIRQENSISILTIKFGSLVGDGLFIAEEYENKINDLILLKLLSNKYDIRNIIRPELVEKFELHKLNIIYKGWLINNRKKFKWLNTILIIDKSYFPDDSIDMEIELETEKPIEYFSKLKQFLSKLDINWIPQRKTKYERFLESINPKSSKFPENS